MRRFQTGHSCLNVGSRDRSKPFWSWVPLFFFFLFFFCFFFLSGIGFVLPELQMVKEGCCTAERAGLIETKRGGILNPGYDVREAVSRPGINPIFIRDVPP